MILDYLNSLELRRLLVLTLPEEKMDEVTSIFGENVFNETVMKARLPKET